MPYELTFSKQMVIADTDVYFNECCIGGDQVVDALLPAIRKRYGRVESNQEDWGWFIWFSGGDGISLGVDIFCEDPALHQFKAHLTSRERVLLFGSRVKDGPALEALKDLVISELTSWTGAAPRVVRLNSKHLPVEDAA